MSERPAPPEHDTPNTGRRAPYKKLVEPDTPYRQKARISGVWVVVGFALASALEVVARIFS